MFQDHTSVCSIRAVLGLSSQKCDFPWKITKKVHLDPKNLKWNTLTYDSEGYGYNRD